MFASFSTTSIFLLLLTSASTALAEDTGCSDWPLKRTLVGEAYESCVEPIEAAYSVCLRVKTALGGECGCSSMVSSASCITSLCPSATATSDVAFYFASKATEFCTGTLAAKATFAAGATADSGSSPTATSTGAAATSKSGSNRGYGGMTGASDSIIGIGAMFVAVGLGAGAVLL